MDEPTDCPCGSGRDLTACCGRYLSRGENAPTAESLMRSRYTAWVLRDADYLRHTWMPANCPDTLALDEPVKWLGLKIKTTAGGGVDDAAGTVEFVARYKLGGRAHRLHETSRFARCAGRWVYVDGS